MLHAKLIEMQYIWKCQVVGLKIVNSCKAAYVSCKWDVSFISPSIEVTQFEQFSAGKRHSVDFQKCVLNVYPVTNTSANSGAMLMSQVM